MGQTEQTEQSKQKIVSKIQSFTCEELGDWILNRLHGYDKYFSIYEGHETNLRSFLADAFNHIKNEKFRDNFLEILGDLISQLRKYDPEEIEKEKEYIYELLTLCRNVKIYKARSILYKLAKSGKFKPFKLRDTDLHMVLLTTLLSYRRGGNYKFWVEQMQDGSNKYYTNAAFYALLKHGYRLDILFDHLGTFIDRFKGGIELVFGIEAMFDYHEPKKIYGMFKKIEPNLSIEQKEAVNHAFIEAEYEPVYESDTKLEKIETEPLYKPSAPQPRYVAAPTFEYKPGTSLKEKAAEIFKFMGFDVEMNREIAGHLIDIFLKKKKSIGNRYECWIGRCDTGKRRVGKDTIDRLYPIREEVREKLEKEPGIDDCQALIISEKGFTKDSMEAAKVYGIELKTPDQLVADLNRFYADQKQLIKDFESMHREDAGEGDRK
jgi:hypothetical protein